MAANLVGSQYDIDKPITRPSWWCAWPEACTTLGGSVPWECTIDSNTRLPCKKLFAFTIQPSSKSVWTDSSRTLSIHTLLENTSPQEFTSSNCSSGFLRHTQGCSSLTLWSCKLWRSQAGWWGRRSGQHNGSTDRQDWYGDDQRKLSVRMCLITVLFVVWEIFIFVLWYFYSQ